MRARARLEVARRGLRRPRLDGAAARARQATRRVFARALRARRRSRSSPQAAAELALANELAGALGVPFTSTKVALANGSNLQARARAARYSALEERALARRRADRDGAPRRRPRGDGVDSSVARRGSRGAGRVAGEGWRSPAAVDPRAPRRRAPAPRAAWCEFRQRPLESGRAVPEVACATRTPSAARAAFAEDCRSLDGARGRARRRSSIGQLWCAKPRPCAEESAPRVTRPKIHARPGATSRRARTALRPTQRSRRNRGHRNRDGTRVVSSLKPRLCRFRAAAQGWTYPSVAAWPRVTLDIFRGPGKLPAYPPIDDRGERWHDSQTELLTRLLRSTG